MTGHSRQGGREYPAHAWLGVSQDSESHDGLRRVGLGKGAAAGIGRAALPFDRLRAPSGVEGLRGCFGWERHADARQRVPATAPLQHRAFRRGANDAARNEKRRSRGALHNLADQPTTSHQSGDVLECGAQRRFG